MDKRKHDMQKIEAKLAKFNAKLDGVKAKAAEARADVKLEYLSQVENLEKKRADFLVKYDQLKLTSEHAWDDVKVGTEKAWSELEETIDKVISRYK